MPYAQNIRRGAQRREHFDSFNFPEEFTASIGDIDVTWGVHQISRAVWRSWERNGWIECSGRDEKDSRGLRVYDVVRGER